jgi:hypothetical protein
VPEEINDVFAKLLKSIDAIYKDDLSFYLLALDNCGAMEESEVELRYDSPENMLTVAHFTASKYDTQGLSHEQFVQHRSWTEEQIFAQSAGLLYVYVGRADGFDALKCWPGAAVRFAPYGMIDTAAVNDYWEREQRKGQVPWPAVLLFEQKIPSWAHWSAQEVIFWIDGSPPRPGVLTAEYNESDILENMLLGAIKYFTIAPSYQITPDREQLSVVRMEDIVRLCGGRGKEELGHPRTTNVMEKQYFPCRL